jgi:enamine deaminase RidA (YjgF/YER057c/UK114 family)
MNGPVVVSATHANPRSMWASLVPEDLQGAAHIVEYVAAEALDEYETFEATRRDAFAAAGADEPSISTIVVDRFVDPESRWQVEITGGVLGDGFVYPPSLVGTTGDIGTQTEEVFEALGRLMGDGAHVVQTVDFTTRATLREYKATGAVRRAHLHPPYPGAAGILMSRLRTRAAKIQLEAVATVLPCAEVNPGWDRYGKLTYRPAVRAGDVLWMAGQGALDPATEQAMYADDLGAQTQYTYENVCKVLEAAGAGPEHLVKLVEYVTPVAIANYEEAVAARVKVIGDQDVPIVSVVCDTLLRREFQIEVVPLAVVR